MQWFHETNGSPVEEVRGEVDRCCSWPGQAWGWRRGPREVNLVRERWRAGGGADYDFKEFNDLMVISGYVPLDVLARNVEAYIAGKTE